MLELEGHRTSCESGFRPVRGAAYLFWRSSVFEFLAALCSGLFSGAAGYISLVEHWARLRAGPEVALAQFRVGFPRARTLQATLAVVGASFAVLACLSGAGRSWLVVAVLLAGIVAFTIVRITPVYRALLDPSLTPADPNAVDLLQRWGRLHHVRSVAGLIAFLIALFAK
jgi:hypothetical protein